MKSLFCPLAAALVAFLSSGAEAHDLGSAQIATPRGAFAGQPFRCELEGKQRGGMAYTWTVVDHAEKRMADDLNSTGPVFTPGAEHVGATVVCSVKRKDGTRAVSAGVEVLNRAPKAEDLMCNGFILAGDLKPSNPAANVSCTAVGYSDPEDDEPLVEARLVCDGRYGGDLWQRHERGTAAQRPCYVEARLADSRGARAEGVTERWIPVVNRWMLKKPYWEH